MGLLLAATKNLLTYSTITVYNGAMSNSSTQPPAFVADENGNLRVEGDDAIISSLNYGQDSSSLNIDDFLEDIVAEFMGDGREFESRSAALFAIAVRAALLTVEAYRAEGKANAGWPHSNAQAANLFTDGLSDHFDSWYARAQYLEQQGQAVPTPAA